MDKLNYEVRKQIAFAAMFSVDFTCLVLDGALHPPWLLMWMMNTAIILGGMVPVVAWKRTRLARWCFWACTAVCFAELPLQLLMDLFSQNWLVGVIPVAVVFDAAWWALLMMPGQRPAPAAVPQVVHHIHHGLPGGAAAALSWTASDAVPIAAATSPVVAGAVERPSVGRRTLRAIAAATTSPAAARRVPDRERVR